MKKYLMLGLLISSIGCVHINAGQNDDLIPIEFNDNDAEFEAFFEGFMEGHQPQQERNDYRWFEGALRHTINEGSEDFPVTHRTYNYEIGNEQEKAIRHWEIINHHVIDTNHPMPLLFVDRLVNEYRMGIPKTMHRNEQNLMQPR